MTLYWGVSAMSHDAALAVYDGEEIVYASHAERYSRVKNDKNLSRIQIREAFEFGHPERIFFYENTTTKKKRQYSAGQYKLLLKQSPSWYLRNLGCTAPVTMVDHHHSHAAYAYYTNPVGNDNPVGNEDQDILVIDSIGEWETLSWWHGDQYGSLEKMWSQRYPNSVGLWYSAMTQRLGLKPQEHEYILMGMAAMGDPSRYYDMIRNDFISIMPSKSNPSVTFKQDLHRGCRRWRPEIVSVSEYVHIAAAVQRIYEEIFMGILACMKECSKATHLSVVGGCALNCVANTLAYNFYENVWVPPNPGDAGSAIGAILSHTEQHVSMPNMFLGTNIAGDYPIDAIIDDLLQDQISAVASGRAEFGPRALGHRSILADPRSPNIKDHVNTIKHREDFRPFAPMILEEHAANYFKLPDVNFTAPYMQFAIPCLRPYDFSGIVHVDGSSRVQTVDKDAGDVYTLLQAWYAETGCPMLLNTSLNIKGEPLVNTVEDAARWEEQHHLSIRIPK